MPVSMLIVGERWRDYYVAGMTLLHILLGHDVAVAPKGDQKFTLLTVAADQLLNLRTRSAQALKVTTPPTFFELCKGDAQ